MSKVEALLADSKVHWNYAHAMAKRMFGIDQVDWLSSEQLIKLIVALTKRKQRSK